MLSSESSASSPLKVSTIRAFGEGTAHASNLRIIRQPEVFSSNYR